MKPFMKWAGGKRQLLDELVQRLPEHYNRYYEPFLGCGALLLHLHPKQAVAGDINKQLINIWLQIRDNVKTVIQELRWLEQIPATKERYLKVRNDFNLLKERQSVSLAAALLWLNAHCFNGLYRVNKNTGNFNVPWNQRQNVCTPDIDNLCEMSEYLKTVDITVRPYQETCNAAEEGDFVYLDPPYAPLTKTSFTAYSQDEFGEREQEKLAAFFRILTERKVFVMLSNHDTPSVRKLYSSYNINTIQVRRNINSDGNNRKGVEVIVTNY